MEIRNIAIIAHVDHGKTTLTDALMKQNGGFLDENLSMDSNDLEKERGITIYSKNTSIYYKNTKINIVDTPGHADFGSEVERVLRAVDSVLLLVDAGEGPMPQTRFVLKKSLELGLKPIVIINKIDKPSSDVEKVHEKILELFFELGANEEQINFETIYAIGREGRAFKNIGDKSENLSPLLDLILEKVKCQRASLTSLSKMPFDIAMSAQVFNLAYDNFLGRMAISRIYSGKIISGSQIFIKNETGTRIGKITKLFTFEGINKVEVKEAFSGDIVLIAGIKDIYIGETLTDDENGELLPHIAIDEPTLSLNFLINDSPFAGREGKFVTGRQLKERLEKELEINVGLKVDFSPKNIEDLSKESSSFSGFKVYGRGELHIAILLENMRREGFEMQVSEPEVIIKTDDNGVKIEPYEELVIDAPTEFSGNIIEKIGKRKGIMKNMQEKENITRIIFEIPTRGLLGFRGEFIIDTKGEGIISSRFIGFKEHKGEIKKREYGSMTSMAGGKAVAFSLANLQERGILYISHGTEVYEGMVIGNVLKGEEMSVNPTKGKQLTNMRASGTDEALSLKPAFILNVETGLEVMNEDEYLEITPKSVRLRKKYLTEFARIKNKRGK